MPRRSFRIGRSITGLGLFAIRPIKKREKIAEYKGPRVSAEEAGRLEAARQPLSLRDQHRGSPSTARRAAMSRATPIIPAIRTRRPTPMAAACSSARCATSSRTRKSPTTTATTISSTSSAARAANAAAAAGAGRAKQREARALKKRRAARLARMRRQALGETGASPPFAFASARPLSPVLGKCLNFAGASP